MRHEMIGIKSLRTFLLMRSGVRPSDAKNCFKNWRISSPTLVERLKPSCFIAKVSFQVSP